ncbi:type I polyketide synthase, partial [Streptomyces sp. E11-3]|uniref:acyltransferase domain-containing protein n=1 Tax=Streptomyces sp. E11-3 TaxID=3110112 RepID=UPI0039809354
SFGISGTNAHVVIEQAPATEPAPHADTASAAPRIPLPWVLSARDEPALRAQADRLRAYVDESADEAALHGVGHALATTRTAFEQRAVVLGTDPTDFRTGLEALASGSDAPGLHLGSAATAGRTAFLFTGQGAQRAAMGRELYAAHPVFAAALDDVLTAFDGLLDRPLREVLFAPEGTAIAEELHRTTYTQPALFAVEVALFRLLEHHGMVPDLLAGHSIGELAAAHAAGVLSLSDAARLVAARGRLMQAAPAGGAMIAIEAEEAEAARSLAGHEAQVSIAAVNDARSVVISGDESAVEHIARDWRDQGRRTHRLAVSHAFHSPHMDGILDRFREVAAGLDFHAPRIPVVSTVTGEIASTEQLTSPDYWTRQIREAVRFADAARQLAAQGATVLVEVGPDAVLTALARRTLEDAAVTAVPLLRAGRPECDTFAAGIAQAHIHGAPLRAESFFPGVRAGSAPAALPTYAFQREHFWLAARPRTDARSLGLDAARHPLLTTVVELADREEALLTTRISHAEHGWLADHAIVGTVLVPATAFLELAMAAGDHIGAPQVAELTLEAPLPLPEHAAVRVQVAVGAPDSGGHRPFTVHARPDGDDRTQPWTRHATGALAPETAPEPTPVLAQWPPDDAVAEELDAVYARLADLGYDYGPAFQGLTAVWRRGADLFAEVRLPDALHESAGAYGIHPALLDSVLHPLVLDAAAGGEADRIRLPFSWSGASLHATGATALRVRISPTGTDTVSLTLADGTSAPVADVESLTLRPVAKDRLAAPAPGSDALFTVEWPQVAAVDPDGSLVWAEVAPGRSLASVPDGADVVVVRADSPDPAATHPAPGVVARQVLSLVQAWLADERFTDATLVLATRNAVATTPTQDVDLTTAAVWGLIRSTQSEHPGRVVLIDCDDAETAAALLPTALATAEPQLAIRDGLLYAPRLAP